ncbi:hypothetical protein VNO77_23677 [Canavalia gladiata]|uniref:Uncharacterized protein n=1 Tax=Canavalia gladiata TaxID=3824 RepID=A0AAN9QBX6_CANGL
MDPLSFISTSSRPCHSPSDLCVEDSEGNDDFKVDFRCPFCSEDYDVVSLCCHIHDHHPLQVKIGRKRRIKKGGSSSTFSILRKELLEGVLQSLLGGTLYIASSHSEADPLLSSFMFNPVVADESVSVPPCPSVEDALVKESSKDDFLERKPQQVQLLEENQVKKARRSDFVKGLLMSTILEDKFSLNL